MSDEGGRRRRRRQADTAEESTTPTSPVEQQQQQPVEAQAEDTGRRRRRQTDSSSNADSVPQPQQTSAPSARKQVVYDDAEFVGEDEAELLQSKLRWIPDETEGFIIAEFEKQEGKNLFFRNDQGELKPIDAKLVAPVNPPKLEGVPDMARLTFLNEASVLHNLKVRYDRNQIYTYSGLFLVAVNPYKNLPIYTTEVVKRYQGRRKEDVEPHVFAVSDVAYRQLLQNQKDQSMLVTGESGAGKTENTKKVIQYLTQVAGAGTGGGKLEQQLIQTNPLLEAFGNAKTLRNNNSSRFGKFIEIDFNAKGYIAGTKIDHYLLETTRVTSQNAEERNFHIFYQITSDADARKKYFLQSAGHYAYLSKSGCLAVEGINDEKEFKDTIESMRIIGMSENEIENTLTTIAAILHLGNISFSDNHDDCSVVKDRDPSTIACKLLGADETKLLDALQRPLLKVGNQVIQKHVTAKEATSNRDSLVKSMYLRLFEWLVARINQSLSTNEKVKNFIGVLDIAGFEIFDNNSFEQLCINFTNEKLQQFFNNHMFKKEQEEYAAERIEWVQQDFGLDLQPTIDLIEGVPSGVFDTLNDVSTFKGATDENFALKVIQVHDKKPVFARYKFDQLCFVVKHYAGEVTYNTRQWLTKNVDPLNDDCRSLLQKSNNEFFRKMFSQKEDLDARMRSSKTSTVAHKYGLQLKKLMDNLNRTEPHFIRCIKPNNVKRPGILEPKEVLDQLRCNGVLEGIRISRQGYPGRIKYQDFVKRYSLLLPSRELEEHSSAKAKSEYIMKAKGFVYTKQYQMGLNKVFLKAGIEAKLEEFREEKLNSIIIVAQAALKGAVGRKKHRQLLNQVEAAAIVQKNFRTYLRLKDWSWYQLYTKCKPLIQKVLEDRKLKAARQKIEDLKKQIQQEIENQKKAEEDKSQLNRDIEKIKADIEISSDRYDRLQQQLNDIQDQLNNREREKNILNNDKESATGALQQVRNAINDFNQKIEKKNNDLDQLKQKITESELQLSKLSGDGKSKDLEIQKFNKRIQTLSKDLKELKDKLDEDHNETLGQIQVQRNLDMKWRETQSQLEMENKIKSEKEQEIKKFEDEVAKLDKDLNKLRKTGGSLETDIDKLKKDTNATEEQINIKQKEFEDVQRQKQQADVVKMDTERKLEEETRNRQQAETKNRLLKTELSDSQTRISQLNESNTGLEDRIAQLKSQINDLQDKLQQLTENRNSLQSKNAELDKLVKDTRFQLEDELSRTKTDLDRANKKLEQALRDYADQIDQANQAKGNLEKKVRNSENDFRTLKRQHDDLTRQLSETESKIRKLEQELNDGDQDKETLRRETAQVEAEKRELESSKKDLESQLQATKDDLNRTQNARKQLQTELEQEKERLSTLEGEKEALEQAKISNEQRKKKLADELSAEKNNGSTLRSDVQNSQRALEDLQSKFQQLQQQIENATGENKSLNDRLAELNLELENEKNAKLSLEKKKRGLESDIKKLKEDLAAELEKLRREQLNKQAVEKSLSDSENNKDNEKRAGDDLQRELAALQGELQATKNKLTEADNEFNRLKGERSDLKRSKEELDEELDDLSNQVDSLNKELKDAESKFNDERNKGNQVTQQKAQLESENNRLKGELERLREEVGVDKKQLLNLLDQLKSQLAQQQSDREREIKKLNDERNDYKNELKTLRKRIDNQPKDPHNSKEYENLKRDYDLQLTKLKKQLEEEANARVDAEAKKKSIESQIEELKNQLSNAEKLRKKIDTQKRQLAMEVDELRELAEEADNLREEIVHYKADSDSLISSMRSELLNERTRRIQSEESSNRTKRENDQLKADLDLERNKVDDQQRRLQQQYESEIEDLHNLLAKAKRDKSSNSRSTKKVDREARELQRKIQQELNEKEEAQNKLAQVEREVKNLKVKQDQASLQLAKIEADKRRAEQTSNSLKQRAFDLEEEISRLRAEAEEERNRRSKLSKRASNFRSDEDDM